MARGRARRDLILEPIRYAKMHARGWDLRGMRVGGSGPLIGSWRFTRFARERSVGLGGGARGEGIERLWRMGWLKADLVRIAPGGTKKRLEELAGRGFAKVGEEGRVRLYADARAVGAGAGTGGVGGAPEAEQMPETIQPLFHPYRYHVLRYVADVLTPNVTALSTLSTAGPESLTTLYGQIFGWVGDHIGSSEFARGLERMNDRVALAVATEPLYYGRVFGVTTLAPRYGPTELGLDPYVYREMEHEELDRRGSELYEEYLEAHRREVHEAYRRAGLERVEEERKRLCQVSETLDPNTDLQTLLRITRGVGRLEIGGTTGGALLTRTMAEMLRRAAEDVFSTALAEEDEASGFSIPRPGAPNVKERRYGSARLLDGERGPEIEFVRSVGLGIGDRVRWYVEGKTEYWALAQLFGTEGEHGVSLVDLRGQFVEGDVLSFRDSLRADLNNHVFSLVSLDGDDDGNLSAVRKAVSDGEFFGSFSVSEPDFELGNFSLGELEEIMWEMAEEGGATEGARQELHEALLKAEERQQKKGELFKGKHVIKAAADNVLDLNQLSKNGEWGRRLMAYANEHPQRTDGKDRPVNQAIDLALQGLRASYVATRRALLVDSGSGDLKAEVPNLSGDSVFAASMSLEERHLRTGEVRMANGEGEEGADQEQMMIVETDPPAGVLLDPDSEVTLLVGPATDERNEDGAAQETVGSGSGSGKEA